MWRNIVWWNVLQCSILKYCATYYSIPCCTDLYVLAGQGAGSAVPSEQKEPTGHLWEDRIPIPKKNDQWVRNIVRDRIQNTEYSIQNICERHKFCWHILMCPLYHWSLLFSNTLFPFTFHPRAYLHIYWFLNSAFLPVLFITLLSTLSSNNLFTI